MLRRMIMAVASLAGAWVLLGQPAGADYPPVPPTVAPVQQVTPTAVAAAPKPKVVVVVRGAPVSPGRVAVTGTSSVIPLTALATASAGLGIVLVCLSRLGWPPHRRHHRHRRRFA